MKITLVGYMASGKSTVGRALAEKLNIPYIDLDSYIEEKTGQSITALMPIKNGLHFRRIEKQSLLEVLELPNFVLGAGGGTPCYYSNMEEINSKSTSFYLSETPKTLSERLMADRSNRPLIQGVANDDLFEFVAKHLFERVQFYERASYTIRTNDKLAAIAEILENDN